MSTVSSAQGAFTAAELDVLQASRMLSAPIANNKRKVSGTSLSPPSSVSSSSSSGSGDLKVKFTQFPQTPNDYTLPMSIDSSEALEWIGFSPEVSRRIYDQWKTRPNPTTNVATLMDYVKSWLKSRDPKQDKEPAPTMIEMGLSQQIQNAMLNPKFTHIFMSESLYYWVWDTVAVNYSTLRNRLKALKARAGRTIRSKGPPKKKTHVADLDLDQPSSSTAQPTAPASVGTMTASTECKDFNLPQNWVASETSPELMSGHIMLWKGCAADRAYDSDGLEMLNEDGTPNMTAWQSLPGGDFNSQQTAYYFSREQATAEQYRCWAAERSPTSNTWLILIQVPETFLSPLRRKELWFGADFKEYVWYCKRKETVPHKYRHYYEGTDVLHGHLVTGVRTRVSKLRADEVQTRFSSDFLFYNDSVKATQTVFMNSDAANELGRQIRGKVHVEIFAATTLFKE